MSTNLNNTSELTRQPLRLTERHVSTGYAGVASLDRDAFLISPHNPDGEVLRILCEVGQSITSSADNILSGVMPAGNFYGNQVPEGALQRVVGFLISYGNTEEIQNIAPNIRALAPRLAPVDVNLRDALQDLAEVVEEAKEDGYPEPSQLAINNAYRLLRAMYDYMQIRYEVYPMPKGEVAIQAFDGKGHSVIVMCDRQGGAMCFVNLESGRRRAVYDRADILLDEFVYKALAEIKENRQ